MRQNRIQEHCSLESFLYSTREMKEGARKVKSLAQHYKEQSQHSVPKKVRDMFK